LSLKFSPEHQWLRLDGAVASVGITPFAQDALGDVVFVDLPAVGRVLSRGEVAGAVESVKTASDVFAPVSGEVVEINEALRADPSLANSDAQGTGWFFKLKPSNLSELDDLLSEAAYLALTGSA
jgi:glycine cleavage system H protein